MNQLITKALLAPCNLEHHEILTLLRDADFSLLCQAALKLKHHYTGKKVFLRGIIEFGNRCAKDCYYCGIRKSNTAVERYQLSESEIVRMAKWAFEQNYGSLVLQSGEIESAKNTEMTERILRQIREFTHDKFGITLSLGEQSEETYKRWLDAGAHRYLLRIETSNPQLYAQLHPADHSFERRKNCLKTLKTIGFQTGSGVMIGVPGQSLNDLASDIQFFRDMDLDMIGMGPYIPHLQTPLGANAEMDDDFTRRQLDLSLRMIAVTRLYLHDVNIAATTALQALDERGREQGLLAGANVMMPNVTDTAYRKNYQLYENKPCLDENAAQCRSCLNWRALGIGEEIAWGNPGTPVHFNRGKQNND